MLQILLDYLQLSNTYDTCMVNTDADSLILDSALWNLLCFI